MARRLVVPKAARSEVWNYFGFEADESGTITDVYRRYVWCRLCDNQLLFSGNTTNLSAHIARCRKMTRVLEQSQSVTQNGSIKNANVSEEILRNHEGLKQGTSKKRMVPDIQKQVLISANNEQNSPGDCGGGGESVTQECESSFVSSAEEQQYCLKWKFHHSNQQTMFAKLLQKESFCDVTIACEEKLLRAHKLVLSACSSYFEMILSLYKDQNPVVILKDVRFEDMSALVRFMYDGEVNIEEGQLQSVLETADFLKIRGLSDIYGQCLGAPAESAGTGNSTGEQQRTRMEHQSNDGQSLDPSRIGQILKKTVSTSEDVVHRPVSIPRRNIGVDVAQDGTGTAAQPPSSQRKNHTDEVDYTEGIISLPDFLKQHGTYQEFWKKPWVVRALRAVSDREMTLRNCSDLLGVGYSILYNRYRQVHGCLKEGLFESAGTSSSCAFKIVRTADDAEKGDEIVLRRDQLSPAAAFSVANHGASSSDQRAFVQPTLNVKLEPVTSVSEMYECGATGYDKEILQDSEDL
ncbi:Protein bric-a-brac 1 [Zootermopsis nevadensis]|uniref:Protein bric-a-brac 1 n=1 Tax=Zootermopsis nevadensis TaxID=136037 RepID=A0A067QKK8_ZOONE|nr:Protein bric-a-brac 1 [Zootermopsis nevadensis]